MCMHGRLLGHKPMSATNLLCCVLLYPFRLAAIVFERAFLYLLGNNRCAFRIVDWTLRCVLRPSLVMDDQVYLCSDDYFHDS